MVFGPCPGGRVITLHTRTLHDTSDWQEEEIDWYFSHESNSDIFSKMYIAENVNFNMVPNSLISKLFWFIINCERKMGGARCHSRAAVTDCRWKLSLDTSLLSLHSNVEYFDARQKGSCSSNGFPFQSLYVELLTFKLLENCLQFTHEEYKQVFGHRALNKRITYCSVF